MIYTDGSREITEEEAFKMIVEEVKAKNTDEEIHNHLYANGELR